MAMHVAKPTDVHQDVEAEAVTCTEGAKQLVVATAMLRAQCNHFFYLRRAKRGDMAAYLTVRIVAARIEQRSGQLDLKWLGIIQKIDDRRRVR